MRMAHCPICGGGNVNNFKKGLYWGSKCYNKECGYTVIDKDYYSRKIARYAWNQNYEKLTGETLPDEMCGRQDRAFTKKERAVGYCAENLKGDSDQLRANEKKRKRERALYLAEKSKKKKREEWRLMPWIARELKEAGVSYDDLGQE